MARDDGERRSRKRSRDLDDDGKPSPRDGFTDELDVATDPNEALRAPLTVLAVLVPVGLLGELYRFVGHPPGQGAAKLLADPMLEATGAVLGLMPPVVPVIVLALGCMLVQLAQRRAWKLPTGRVVLIGVCWSLAWAAARVALALAARGLDARFHADSIVEQVGLGVSGALQEELLFRGILLGALLLLGRFYGAPKWLAASIAVALSAVFFSLAHTHVVNHYAGAEAFAWPAFIERALAGALYGVVFVRQGLAVCTLAHAGYNLAWCWLA